MVNISSTFFIPRRRSLFVADTCSWRLAGEDRLGRSTAEKSKYYRLYLHRGKVALAAMYLRLVRVVGRTSAPNAPPLTSVSTALRLRRITSAWAYGGPAGSRRGGMLGATARIAPARPTTPPKRSVNGFQ